MYFRALPSEQIPSFLFKEKYVIQCNFIMWWVSGESGDREMLTILPKHPHPTTMLTSPFLTFNGHNYLSQFVDLELLQTPNLVLPKESSAQYKKIKTRASKYFVGPIQFYEVHDLPFYPVRLDGPHESVGL